MRERVATGRGSAPHGKRQTSPTACQARLGRGLLCRAGMRGALGSKGSSDTCQPPLSILSPASLGQWRVGGSAGTPAHTKAGVGSLTLYDVS